MEGIKLIGFYLIIFFAAIILGTINAQLIEQVFKFSYDPTFTSFYYAYLDLNFIDDVRIKLAVKEKESFYIASLFFLIISLIVFYILNLVYLGILNFIFGPQNDCFKVENEDVGKAKISIFNLLIFGSYYISMLVFSPFFYRPVLNFCAIIFTGHLFIYYRIFDLRKVDEQIKFQKITTNVQTFIFLILSFFWFKYFVENLKNELNQFRNEIFYLIHFILYVLSIIIGYFFIKVFDYFIGLNGISLKSLQYKQKLENEIKEKEIREREEKERIKRSEKVKIVKKIKSVNVNSNKDSNSRKDVPKDGDWNKGLREFQNTLKNVNSKIDFKSIKGEWILCSKRNNKFIVIEIIDESNMTLAGVGYYAKIKYKLTPKGEFSIELNDSSKLIGNYSGNEFTGFHYSENGKWAFEMLQTKPFLIKNNIKSIKRDTRPGHGNPIVGYVKNDEKISEPIPIEVVEKKIVPAFSYQPKSNIQFTINNKNNFYSYNAIFQYYPVNRYSSGELDAEDLNNRSILYGFKDGRNVKYNADLFASALLNKFGREELNKKCLMIIPASTKEKTEIRFKEFCELLSEYTQMENGYQYLINSKDREPSHKGGSRNYNPEEYLKIVHSLEGKEIIIIDDVRTSGRSSDNIYNFIKKENTKSITFCYMARTV